MKSSKEKRRERLFQACFVISTLKEASLLFDVFSPSGWCLPVSERVLGSPRNSLEVGHASSAFASSALSLSRPAEFPHLHVGEPTRATAFLLIVKGSSAAAPTQRVCFGVSLPETRCSFAHFISSLSPYVRSSLFFSLCRGFSLASCRKWLSSIGTVAVGRSLRTVLQTIGLQYELCWPRLLRIKRSRPGFACSVRVCHRCF